MTTSTAPHLTSTRRLLLTGAVAGVIAAACTTCAAAVASAAGVSLDVSAQSIPLPAFAMWTLIGATVGVVLARVLRDRRRFIVVTTIGTALSLVPAIVMPDDVATKAVLVVAHLLAAAVVIPALSRPLATTKPTPPAEREQ